MSIKPCRLCPKCGCYYDISVLTCGKCRIDLSNIPALLIDTETITRAQIGVIEDNVSAFVQKCPVCGALNFTSDQDKPIKRCYNCHKIRVSSAPLVEYKPETEEKDDGENGKDIGGSEHWQNIIDNIRETVSENTTSKIVSDVEPASFEEAGIRRSYCDDNADWQDILGTEICNSSKNGMAQKKHSITLTAITYGRLSFTIEANSNAPYMLGRSANQSDFLSNDGRVGNEHCYLMYKEGGWYVKDNHSKNGTAVNSLDIGEGGEHVLNNGDELKLGHHPDSMAFRITI